MNTLIKLKFVAITLALNCLAFTAFAEQPADTQEQAVYGWELMTDQERQEHRNTMQSLKTQEERDQYRKKHHEKMQARAKERGVTIPDIPIHAQIRNQDKFIYGYQLMTQQEMAEHRKQMQSFKTETEREKYRQEHHAKMQARAKERGFELPDTPMGAGYQGMHQGGAGLGPRQGKP